jgi:hypothetical protein
MMDSHDRPPQVSEHMLLRRGLALLTQEPLMSSAGKRPVLIVEDEVLVSIVVEELIAEAGFDPVVAHDADAAIALLEAEVEGTLQFSPTSEHRESQPAGMSAE